MSDLFPILRPSPEIQPTPATSISSWRDWIAIVVHGATEIAFRAEHPLCRFLLHQNFQEIWSLQLPMHGNPNTGIDITAMPEPYTVQDLLRLF